jgi:hypothetical protein
MEYFSAKLAVRVMRIAQDNLNEVDTSEIHQLIADFVDCADYLKNSHNKIQDLENQIKILEAENKLLKEHPVDCGDPNCGPYGQCICYTR